MATSGSYNTTHYGGSGDYDRYIEVAWSRASYDIAENSSTINYTVYMRSAGSSTSSWVYQYATKVVIAGQTVYSKDSSGRKCYKNEKLASGSLKIYHDENGNASFSSSATAYIYYGSSNQLKGSGSWTLDTIPRKSDVSLSTTELTTNTAVTINTNRKSTSFTHTITYSFGSLTGTIGDNKVGDSVSWTPNRDLLTQIPNVTRGTGTITCTTYNGTTKIGTSTASFGLTADSGVVPSISSASVSDGNSIVTSKSLDTYVQGKSYLVLSVSANGSSGSTISSIKCNIDGTEYIGSNISDLNSKISKIALNTPGTKSMTVYVTDSRGRTSATKTLNYTVTAYSTPTITAYSAGRCTSNGILLDDGTYLKIQLAGSVSSINNKNPMTVKVGYKLKTSSTYDYTTYVNASKTVSSVNYTGTNSKIFGNGNLAASNSYDVIFSVSDCFTTITRTLDIGTGFDLIHYNTNGKALAFGKKSEATGDQAMFEFGAPIYYKNKELLNLIYPIGSIYMNTTDVDPGTIFGGTWERIQNKFLLCSGTDYEAGTTGGNASVSYTPAGSVGGHTLTANEIPAHTHGSKSLTGQFTLRDSNTSDHNTILSSSGIATASYPAWSGSHWGMSGSTFSGYKYNRIDLNATHEHSSVGGGGSHNHGFTGTSATINTLPPYLAVYVWKRTG